MRQPDLRAENRRCRTQALRSTRCGWRTTSGTEDRHTNRCPGAHDLSRECHPDRSTEIRCRSGQTCRRNSRSPKTLPRPSGSSGWGAECGGGAQAFPHPRPATVSQVRALRAICALRKSDSVSARYGPSGAVSRKRNSRTPRDCEEYGCLSTPTGSRTPVFELRTRRPGPLDDGGVYAVVLSVSDGVSRRLE